MRPYAVEPYPPGLLLEEFPHGESSQSLLNNRKAISLLGTCSRGAFLTCRWESDERVKKNFVFKNHSRTGARLTGQIVLKPVSRFGGVVAGIGVRAVFCEPNVMAKLFHSVES